MGAVTFVFALHNHQPLGNFPNVFEEAYQKAYLPFLECAERHPGIRFCLHNTGILLDWYEEHHPDMLDRLKALVDADRLEPISGAYYEPILPPMPDRDKIGQITKLNERIEGIFGTAPQGMWVAERVWEPHLPGALHQAGVGYVVMDDSHFKAAGLRGTELHGYFRTEEQGHSINCFPIDEQLRYYIPFQDVNQTRDYLAGLAETTENAVVVFADDGEKFGIWPQTYHSVYEQGWLEAFFTMLEENSSWIHLRTFSEVLDEFSAMGNVYIPSASYSEMMEWALPADRTQELEDLMARDDSAPFRLYMRGGSWRNFFSKYAESNTMHKRSLYISERAEKAKGKQQKAAQDALWRAQCNCGYWHGVFGGIYLNHLRTEIYRNLIDAEIALEQNKNKNDWIEVDHYDLLCNGGECAVVRSRDLTFCVDSASGGSLFELSYKPKRFNVLNTMTRRPEAYHRDLEQAVLPGSDGDQAASIHDIVWTKEEGLAEKCYYDWYRRSALIDHLLPLDASLDDFLAARQHELCDMPAGDYTLSAKRSKPKSGPQQAVIRLDHSSHAETPAGPQPFNLTKTLTHHGESSEIEIAYQLKNTGTAPIEALFGVEFGFSLLAGNTPDRYYCIPDVDLGHDNKLGTVGELAGVPWVRLVEEWIGLEVRIDWDEPATLWRFPIETISNSEGGFERSYQSSVVFPHWPITLAGGKTLKRAFRLKVGSL